MYTSYHFSSAQEISPDIIRSIQDIFQSKPITIIVEEDEMVPEGMTSEMVDMLEDRLEENLPEYMDASVSLQHLKVRYALPD